MYGRCKTSVSSFKTWEFQGKPYWSCELETNLSMGQHLVWISPNKNRLLGFDQQHMGLWVKRLETPPWKTVACVEGLENKITTSRLTHGWLVWISVAVPNPQLLWPSQELPLLQVCAWSMFHSLCWWRRRIQGDEINVRKWIGERLCHPQFPSPWREHLSLRGHLLQHLCHSDRTMVHSKTKLRPMVRNLEHYGQIFPG